MMALLILAFLTGTVLSALIGNAVEIQTGSAARLGEPLVSGERIGRSLLLVAVAGPYLLVNEAFAVLRASHFALGITTVLFAAMWAIASGILWLEFFVRLSHTW